MSELNIHTLAEPKKKEKKNWLVTWLYNHRNQNDIWALKYSLCEILNLVNVVLQLVFINWFVGGEFWQYGAAVLYYLQLDQWDRVDPMVKTFPKMTKCTFHRFGSSGDVMKFDNLCLLPLNIINEKIYVLLWFWLLFVLAVTTLWLFWRLALILLPSLRYWALLRLSPLFSARKSGDATRDDPTQNIEIICERLSYGDWFLLYMLGWNLHSLHFKEVLEGLAYRLDEHSLEYVVDSGTLEASNGSDVGGSDKGKKVE